MKTRKLTAILLALCMLLSLSISAFAADDAIASGTIQDSKITWELDGKGWLTISGSGDCSAFASKDDQPWAEYPRCNFTTGNVSGCTNTTSEQRQEVWKENVSIRIPSYKPHSVFRVRRFLSSEGAERNGQMGLLQTRSRHNRLQFRLLQ